MKASDGAQDKFYTRPAVVRFVVPLIPDLGTYAEIVEPSAGGGVFLDALPERATGYDIAPDDPRVAEADWLSLRLAPKRGLLVGNPPFGRRSALAKAFIKHGVALGFETIAFILPATFRKLTTQTCFPDGWRLIVDADLPDDVFEHADGDIGIPCVFQVWTRRPGALNLRKTKPAQPDAYAFLPRGDARATVCLNGNSGRVRWPSEVTNPKAEHYIQVISGGQDTIDALSRLDLEFRSSVSGGVSWVSKAEINAAWWARTA